MKEHIIALIEERLATVPESNGVGRCMYIAHTVATVLYKAGLSPIIQAGTLCWPRINRHEDDGIMMTHFSYYWSPNSKLSRVAMAMGALPEMHVWIGLVNPQEVVDFSTRYFKEELESSGLKWTADDPPQYLWSHSLPDWVAYLPNRSATMFACYILKRHFKVTYLGEHNYACEKNLSFD